MKKSPGIGTLLLGIVFAAAAAVAVAVASGREPARPNASVAALEAVDRRSTGVRLE